MENYSKKMKILHGCMIYLEKNTYLCTNNPEE